jgi:hypothetical protein
MPGRSNPDSLLLEVSTEFTQLKELEFRIQKARASGRLRERYGGQWLQQREVGVGNRRLGPAATLLGRKYERMRAHEVKNVSERSFATVLQVRSNFTICAAPRTPRAMAPFPGTENGSIGKTIHL